MAKALQEKFSANTMLLCHDVILEGILDPECYRELFECAIEEYGPNIYAYYYDLPFEETLLGMKRSRIVMSSEKVICAAGGRKRILLAVFRKRF